MPQLVREPFTAIPPAREANHTRSKHLWLLLNVCSLDAPIVAVLWQLLLQKCLHIDAGFEVSAALFLSVWIIYLSDRLLDAARWRSGALAPRHEFCRRYSNALMALALAALFAVGWLCGRIDPLIPRNGVILLTAVICYFGLVHLGSASVRSLWPKELFVGTIFSLGTFLPAWTLNAGARPEIVPSVVLFALLCTLNCITIEFREWRSHQSEINILPDRLTLWIGTRLTPATALVAAGSAICFVVAPEQMQPFYACCLLSSASLCSIAWRSAHNPAELVPVLADAALFSPLLALAALK